jgi:hypothetical protein
VRQLNCLQLLRYQLSKPQVPVPGAQVGAGIALVLAVALGVALAKLEAKAPVTARAITKLRTMNFMMGLLFLGYFEWAELNFSLDTPDGTTLGCLS